MLSPSVCFYNIEKLNPVFFVLYWYGLSTPVLKKWWWWWLLQLVRFTVYTVNNQNVNSYFKLWGRFFPHMQFVNRSSTPFQHLFYSKRLLVCMGHLRTRLRSCVSYSYCSNSLVLICCGFALLSTISPSVSELDGWIWDAIICWDEIGQQEGYAVLKGYGCTTENCCYIVQ